MDTKHKCFCLQSVLYSISRKLAKTKPQATHLGLFAFLELQLTGGPKASRPGVGAANVRTGIITSSTCAVFQRLVD